jgi:hypothetical protein
MGAWAGQYDPKLTSKRLYNGGLMHLKWWVRWVPLSEMLVGGRNLVERPSYGFALSDAVVMLREDPHILDSDEDLIALPQP